MLHPSTSSSNLRVRSTNSRTKKPTSPTRPCSPQKQPKFDHKKEIQATLNELHQLQAEIYSLNVPQNPHSSGPTKKEIKQLSYLYESMTKPKVKNGLGVGLKEIRGALMVVNEGMQAIDEKANPYKAEINRKKKLQAQQQSPPTKSQQISLLRDFQPTQHPSQQPQSSLSIPSKTLKQVMKQLYHTEFDLSLISSTKTSRVAHITADQIDKFINYNEFDGFDPLREAYDSLLDDNGRFSFKKYNEINEIFGLPKVKELAILKDAVGLKEGEEMTFQKFREIMQDGTQIGFV